MVVPVYRGELTLKKLVSEIIGFFNSEKLSFEILFVNDSAPDKSWEIINSLKMKYGEVIKGIRLSRNFGQHNALLCGMINATGEYIITMDEDLQHSPYDIIKLINKQEESDYDLVYGRFRIQNHNIFRNLTSELLKRLLRIGLPGLHPDYSAFRLIKAEIAEKAVSKAISYAFIDVYFSMLKSKTASTVVNHSKRYAGRSSYNLQKLVKHTISILVNYSVTFIRVLSWSFLFLAFIFFCCSAYFVLRIVFHNTDRVSEFSIYEIAGIFLLLTILIAGAINIASLIVSVLKIRRSGFIESEII